jgi:hypothetical protein
MASIDKSKDHPTGDPVGGLSRPVDEPIWHAGPRSCEGMKADPSGNHSDFHQTQASRLDLAVSILKSKDLT